jgi:hypothetical protein
MYNKPYWIIFFAVVFIEAVLQRHKLLKVFLKKFSVFGDKK